MGRRKFEFDVVGIDEVLEALKGFEKLPQKCVSRAAKSGAEVAKDYAVWNAPYKTGELRKGIILKRERNNLSGKQVYQVVIDPKKNNIFLKYTIEGERYYYPASQEYGFIKRNGGIVPGKHYLRNSLMVNKRFIEKTMIDELIKEIDKLK